MKDGWKQCALGDLCQIQLGSTPARRSPALWDPERVSRNVWLSIADLPEGVQSVAVDSKEYISDRAAQKARLVKRGTLLVSFKLTLGRLAYAGCDLFTNEAIAALTINDEDTLRQKYLYWYLTSFDWQKYAELDDKLKGKTLNKAKLKTLPVLLPPPAEQEHIAVILNEAFKAIATATANTVRAQSLANELMTARLESMLAQGTARSRDAKLGEIILSARGGISIKSSEYGRSGTPVLTKGDVKPFGGIEPGGKHVDSDYVRDQGWPLADPGDLLVTTRDLKRDGPFLGLVARVPPDRSYLVNQGATFFKLDERQAVPDYVVYWACCEAFRRHIRESKSGATQVHIRQDKLFAAPIRLPSLEGQESLARKIDRAYGQTLKLIDLCQRKLQGCYQLRQATLKKAFSGELTGVHRELSSTSV